MRRALAALAASAALLACSVDVEGARCRVELGAEDCPSGQACGNDGTCSERAAACAGTRCTAGALRCGGLDGTERVERCADTDAVCGAWVADEPSCTASGLVCGTGSGVAVCEPVVCLAAGSADGCPPEQACGNDLVCSTAGAACAATRCEIGALRCGGAGETEKVEICAALDAACSGWTDKESCTASGLVCGTRTTGGPACEALLCGVPGSTTGCLPGQACGNDGKCSKAAADCTATRCDVDAVRCGGTGGTEKVEICKNTDAVCGRWEPLTPCAPSGLRCVDPAGAPPACEPIPCSVPGSTEGCLGGQACGNDRVCSGAAAMCTARCDVGALRCGGGGGTERVERCADTNVVCGVWDELTQCAASGLLCVDREGAPPACEVPCSVPGSTAGCPSGQACGNDGTCSMQAAACAALCDVDTLRCGGMGGTEKVERCSGAHPVCGVWAEQQSCAGSGLRCVDRDGEPPPTCECPANMGATFAADPGGSADPAALPYPTGVESPRACRFGRLGEALSRAAAYARPATVKSYGEPGAPVVFDATTGDTLPLTVASNVTLAGADAPAGATIVRASAGDGQSVLSVQGGIVSGVHVENQASTGVGVATSCLTAPRPAIRDAVVTGGARGVDVTGCGAELTRVTVSGAAGEGIVFHGNTVMDVMVDQAVVATNGGTGVVAESISTDSSVTISHCDVHSNGSNSPRLYGPGTPRKAGGVFLSQNRLSSFQFVGNSLYANEGDELVIESDRSWSVTAGSPCGTATNVFGCSGADFVDFALAIAGGGSIDATWTTWPRIPATTVVSGAVTCSSYCNGVEGARVLPACPPP